MALILKPAPGLTLEQQPEAVLLRCLMWGEARSEPARGRLAVLWVAHNRAMKRDSTLKAEILRPLQFSCFNSNDPNRAKLLNAHSIDPAGWAAADAIAILYQYGNTTDPTEGATHYYVAKMKNPPEWGRGHKDWDETVEIGAHVFGRAA